MGLIGDASGSVPPPSASRTGFFLQKMVESGLSTAEDPSKKQREAKALQLSFRWDILCLIDHLQASGSRLVKETNENTRMILDLPVTEVQK